MSDTPRTDEAELSELDIRIGHGPSPYVPAELARQFERALQAFCHAFTNRGETTSLKEWNDRLTAAHDHAREVLAGREPYSEPTRN